MNYRRFPAVLILAALAVAFAARRGRSQQRTDKYPDGTRRTVYSVDSEGRRHGEFRQYYPNGRLKTDARYLHGLLHGPYVTYHPNGKRKVEAAHRRGRWHGPYVARAADGSPFRSAAFRDGKLHGPHRQFDGKRLVKDQYWLAGELIFPKSAKLIDRRLESIAKMPIQTVGRVPAAGAEVIAAVRDRAAHAKREAALRRLMAYRYLCDLPYRDVQLDWNYTAHAVAAARIMNRLNKLTHAPENPGWPQADYEFARKGAGSSNISSSPSLSVAIEMFIGDSDGGNIDRLGHRRWCLNPTMQRTGFGAFGKFSAMWSFDRSRRDVPEFDYVAFPPRGLMPRSMFEKSWAWNVSLNKDKYAAAEKGKVKVRIAPVRLDVGSNSLWPAGQPLKLDYFNVDTHGFGIDNCVIFRPAGVATDAGAVYSVIVSGLVDSKGKPAALRYAVGFY